MACDWIFVGRTKPSSLTAFTSEGFSCSWAKGTLHCASQRREGDRFPLWTGALERGGRQQIDEVTRPRRHSWRVMTDRYPPLSDRAWWSGDSRATPAPRFAGTTSFSQHVAARDGTRIAVDVYLPAQPQASERLPTILAITPY